MVTTIGTYIAMSPSDPSGGHGHDDHGHGKDHEEHAEESKEEEEPKEESKDEPEAKTEDKSEEKSDDKSEEKSEEKSEKSDDKSEDKPAEEEKTDDRKEDESKDDSKPEDKSEDKGEDKSDDTNAQKGTDRQVTQGGSDDIAKLHKGATKDKTDIKHREEDKGKGATKVRMDSPAGKTIGEGSSAGEGDEMTKKQKGISTTDTKHSTDPHADPGKSSKGEGTAETAKIKGTVKPDRPQV